MKRRLKEPFGKAGLIVGVIALVFAMLGGAYAAGGLTKSQEKQVTKIAKKYAGKPGAAGANGTNGTNGSPGAKGDTGSAGGAGTNGKSVAVTTVTSPGCNGQAGAEVKQEGAASGVKVCNGTTGFTETLPSEKTETGAWAFSSGGSPSFSKEPIASFTIPLSAPLDGSGCFTENPNPGVLVGPCHVHYINPAGKEVVENVTPGVESFEELTPTGCGTGTAAAPEAEPGNLCVYAQAIENLLGTSSFFIENPGTGSPGAGTTGAIQVFFVSAGAKGSGTWAVTAP